MSRPQAITTVSGWLQRGAEHLRRQGVDECEANAEFIMAHVLELKRPGVLAQGTRTLDEKQKHQFWHLILERAKRLPLAYVLGEQPFLGLDFLVTPSVLVPRPETEGLVEAVLEELGGTKGPQHILEVGTGSGCISVALAVRLPEAFLYATDISRAALELAERNARRHGVERRVRLLREDLFRPEARPTPWADALVSNPPYIPSGDLRGLSAEVLREPFLALDGGKDGLDAVRAIAASAIRLLKPGGLLALEIGSDQAEAVRGILARQAAAGCPFEEPRIRKDLQGLDRVVLARRCC
ncbi:MAG: peptide chain release factor N(5)-glutamine methyltransferase [Elusimicrobiota bacterium]|jgi:release factor glutamine methyltransferase